MAHIATHHKFRNGPSTRETNPGVVETPNGVSESKSTRDVFRPLPVSTQRPQSIPRPTRPLHQSIVARPSGGSAGVAAPVESIAVPDRVVKNLDDLNREVRNLYAAIANEDTSAAHTARYHLTKVLAIMRQQINNPNLPAAVRYVLSKKQLPVAKLIRTTDADLHNELVRTRQLWSFRPHLDLAGLAAREPRRFESLVHNLLSIQVPRPPDGAMVPLLTERELGFIPVIANRGNYSRPQDWPNAAALRKIGGAIQWLKQVAAATGLDQKILGEPIDVDTPILHEGVITLAEEMSRKRYATGRRADLAGRPAVDLAIATGRTAWDMTVGMLSDLPEMIEAIGRKEPEITAYQRALAEAGQDRADHLTKALGIGALLVGGFAILKVMREFGAGRSLLGLARLRQLPNIAGIGRAARTLGKLAVDTLLIDTDISGGVVRTIVRTKAGARLITGTKAAMAKVRQTLNEAAEGARIVFHAGEVPVPVGGPSHVVEATVPPHALNMAGTNSTGLPHTPHSPVPANGTQLPKGAEALLSPHPTIDELGAHIIDVVEPNDLDLDNRNLLIELGTASDQRKLAGLLSKIKSNDVVQIELKLPAGATLDESLMRAMAERARNQGIGSRVELARADSNPSTITITNNSTNKSTTATGIGVDLAQHVITEGIGDIDIVFADGVVPDKTFITKLQDRALQNPDPISLHVGNTTLHIQNQSVTLQGEIPSRLPSWIRSTVARIPASKANKLVKIEHSPTVDKAKQIFLKKGDKDEIRFIDGNGTVHIYTRNAQLYPTPPTWADPLTKPLATSNWDHVSAKRRDDVTLVKQSRRLKLEHVGELAADPIIGPKLQTLLTNMQARAASDQSPIGWIWLRALATKAAEDPNNGWFADVLDSVNHLYSKADRNNVGLAGPVIESAARSNASATRALGLSGGGRVYGAQAEMNVLDALLNDSTIESIYVLPRSATGKKRTPDLMIKRKGSTKPEVWDVKARSKENEHELDVKQFASFPPKDYRRGVLQLGGRESPKLPSSTTGETVEVVHLPSTRPSPNSLATAMRPWSGNVGTYTATPTSASPRPPANVGTHLKATTGNP